jgi:hypothetical protein
MRNSDARAMDVVARLSGVNFGSVEKVFAALDTLYKVRGLSTASVVSIQNAPALSVFVDTKFRDRRSRATDREIAFIMEKKHLLPENIQNILMLDLRFGSSTIRKIDTTGDKKPPTEPQKAIVGG